MTEQELSIQAGKHYNFLAHYKCTNNAKYKLFKEFGITGFDDECARVRNELSTMYYELYEKRHIAKFCRDHLSEHFTGCIRFSMWLSNNAFGVSETMSAATYKQALTLLEIYNRTMK